MVVLRAVVKYPSQETADGLIGDVIVKADLLYGNSRHFPVLECNKHIIKRTVIAKAVFQIALYVDSNQ